MLRKHKKDKIIITDFRCSRMISDRNHKSLISTFSCSKNPSLAGHLKYKAWGEEQNNKRAYFLIKEGNKIVLYFSLQCGLLIKSNEKILGGINHRETAAGPEYYINSDIVDVTKTVPAIELAHFCVNDTYRQKKIKWKILNGPFEYRVGQYCFYEYIAPIIIDIADKIGVEIVYLFCADDGNQTLFDYYSSLNFSIMDNMACVRSDYEANLLCMTQKISTLKNAMLQFNDEKKVSSILEYLKTHKNISNQKMRKMFEIADVCTLISKMLDQKLIIEDPIVKNAYKTVQ